MSPLDLLLMPAAVLLLVLVLQYALIFGWVLAVVLRRMARSVLPGTSLRKRTLDNLAELGDPLKNRCDARLCWFHPPAKPPSLATAVPNWRCGDTIPLGRRTLRVVRLRDDDADQPPVLVVEDVA